MAMKVEIHAFTGTGCENIVSWFIDLVALLIEWSCLIANLRVSHLHNSVIVWLSFAHGHASKYHVTITCIKCLIYYFWWVSDPPRGFIWTLVCYWLPSKVSQNWAGQENFIQSLRGRKWTVVPTEINCSLNTCHHITPHGRKFRLIYIPWQGFGYCWPPTSWKNSPGFFTIHTLVSQFTTDMSQESKYSYCLLQRKPNCQRKG